MMAMWMNAEMTALTQPPFFLSRPADSIRTSSNIAGPLRFRVDANLGFTSGASLLQGRAARQRVHRRVGGWQLTRDWLLAVGCWPLRRCAVAPLRRCAV